MRIFRSCYGRWLLALGGILLLGLVIGWLQLQRAPKQLRIGVFAGSNWGVPAADSYGIIDMRSRILIFFLSGYIAYAFFVCFL